MLELQTTSIFTHLEHTVISCLEMEFNNSTSRAYQPKEVISEKLGFSIDNSATTVSPLFFIAGEQMAFKGNQHHCSESWSRQLPNDAKKSLLLDMIFPHHRIYRL